MSLPLRWLYKSQARNCRGLSSRSDVQGGALLFSGKSNKTVAPILH